MRKYKTYDTNSIGTGGETVAEPLIRKFWKSYLRVMVDEARMPKNMMPKTRNKIAEVFINRVSNIGHQVFCGVYRSRTGDFCIANAALWPSELIPPIFV